MGHGTLTARVQPCSLICSLLSLLAGFAKCTIEDLKGGNFGISRKFSGSHLMAYVLARQRGWDSQTDVDFTVIGGFQELRDR